MRAVLHRHRHTLILAFVFLAAWILATARGCQGRAQDPDRGVVGPPPVLPIETWVEGASAP